MNKTILITGSLGFIGSHLSEFFLKKDFTIIGIDNLSNNYSQKLYKNNLNLLKKYNNFIFYKANILNKKKIFFIIKKCQPNFLIHCAAKVGVRESINNPALYNKINILGSQTLLEAIRLLGPKIKIILVSSSSVYGNNKIPFTEETKPQPLSPYGISKYQMEIKARQYSKSYNLSIIIVRAFSVYGPRGRTDMLPFLIIKNSITNKQFNIYGSNRNNRRDWTYVDDLVDAIDKIINMSRYSQFEVINIGRGQSIGIDDFIDYFLKELKKFKITSLKIKKTQKKEFESNFTLANIDKAKKILNFTPKVSYKEGINKTVKYFMENKTLYFDD